ncbi:MAG: ComEC/Rec2 family competence protein [Saprospiraceae bacterium]|nr:ComEC/Rec2 family competence protein [Saprospiraceae bacterium]
MIFWGNKPFGRLVIALIIGIVTSRYYPIYCNHLYLIFGILFTIFLVSTKNKSRYREYYTGTLLILVTFLLGYTRYSSLHPNMDWTHYSHSLDDTRMYMSAKILTIPKKTTRYSCFIQINAIGSSIDSMNNVTGKITAYFKLEDSIASTYSPGDEILFNGYVIALRHSRNPNTFDFNDYLKTKHIFHRVDIAPELHSSTSKNLANPIERLANKIRSHALKTFDKYLDNNDHRSLTAAMVLGFRNTINPELYASYTKSGAVHVLAVSGLHVGILCQIILFFLNKLFKSSNRDKLIKLSLLAFSTSTYIIITGGSAAVMRASVMIIIYYVGKYWADRVDSYNVLSMTAFFLMIYDPYMIFQASFQFSFLALLSILYFYKPIYEWLFNHIEINSRLINYMWQMIALSMSAQILVAPLTIYYFHKFPTYFWLSGIVAVPAAYCVLVLGILMIIIEYILPFANEIIEILLTSIFEVFIYSIQTIEHLPLATIDNLWLYIHELLLLYISLCLFLAARHALKANYILASLTVFMIFTLSRYHNINESETQAAVTIYDNYKGHIIDFYDGRTCYSICSEQLAEKTVEFITSNNRVNRKITELIDLNPLEVINKMSFIKSQNLIQFKDESILLLDSNYIDHKNPIDINTAIVLGGMKSRMDTIKKYVRADKWIITQSEKQYKQLKWKQWCGQNAIECVSIKDHGAYSYDILNK